MQRQQGFTLTEMLVILAVLGIALATSISFLQMPSSRLYANDIKSMIQQARFESIKRNVAVAVVWSDTAQAFEMRVNQGNDQSCTAVNRIKSQPLSEYRNLTLDSDDLPGNGLVWLPNGQVRNCNNGLMDDNEITVSDKRTTIQVVLSRAGKVSLQ